MSWKDKLHPIVSNAEMAVLAELKRLGVMGIEMQKQICIDKASIDFYLISHSNQPLCIFLDGPPHLKEKVELRDEHVDESLTKMGYKVLRFPYKPPLSKKALKEIVDRILEESVGKGRTHV